MSDSTPQRPRCRAAALALATAVAGSLVLASSAFAGIFTPESGGSANADKIHSLYVLIFGMGIVVFVVVTGVMFWAMVKFRARKGHVAAQIHGNTKLEIGWTAGAALILVFITTVTFVQLNGIKNPAKSDIDSNGQPIASAGPSGGQGLLFASTEQPGPPGGNALNIRVDGQQYVWRYQYPGAKQVYAYTEMVVPVGQTVTLDVTADDVAHSWWIPKLGGKFDAIPGYVNKTWFKATKPGVFKGQCAELCGRNHANMLATVRAVPYDEYRAWFDQQAATIQSARDLGAKQREALIRQQGQQAADRSPKGEAAPVLGSE